MPFGPFSGVFAACFFDLGPGVEEPHEGEGVPLGGVECILPARVFPRPEGAFQSGLGLGLGLGLGFPRAKGALRFEWRLHRQGGCHGEALLLETQEALVIQDG